VNLARLNHVLIPSTKEERDRLRRGRFAQWVFGPLARTWMSLTDEGRGLLGLSVIASLVGLDVVHGQNHLLWALCFSLLAASVAARPLVGVRGLHIAVQGPRRIVVGSEARFRIRLANDGDRTRSALRVRLPFLPWDGTWLDAERRVAELPPGARVTVEARARFVERGHHHLDPFAVGALVPLGLATGPSVESRGTRFVVVPRIAPVARIELVERARHQQGGIALASRTGESTELLGLRAWRDGDRLRDLHAPSWARLGEPVVREYQQEYFTRIGVVFDADAAGLGEPRFEAAVSLTAGLLEHLLRGEAVVDLTCTDGTLEPLTVGRSLGGLDQALDRLAGLRPGAAFDPEIAFAQLGERLDRLAAVVLVTLRRDGARRGFAERLRAAGIGVRVIRVAGDEGRPGPDGPGERCITTRAIDAAIASREGLWL
jgi:uncharacterized protein (DUF58 family)